MQMQVTIKEEKSCFPIVGGIEHETLYMCGRPSPSLILHREITSQKAFMLNSTMAMLSICRNQIKLLTMGYKFINVMIKGLETRAYSYQKAQILFSISRFRISQDVFCNVHFNTISSILEIENHINLFN